MSKSYTKDQSTAVSLILLDVAQDTEALLAILNAALNGDAAPEPPRRRSWPGRMTRLERLAEAAGLHDEELRVLLAEQIQRRRRERGDKWKALDETLEERERRNGGSPHQC